MSERKHWKKTVVRPDATIQEVIRCLDEAALQIVLVLTPDGALIGTITDGDIRRGLLRGLGMESPIDSIIQRDAFVVPPEMDRDTVLQIMRANKFHQVPVVDEKRRVLDLYTWDALTEQPARDNAMIIMAGGFGTRLRPHTEECPKPLVPVDGKPMMEYIIEQAKGEGFRRFIVATHYLGYMIEDHFGAGDRWGVEIEYIEEEQPLGTAGALAYIRGRLDAPFVVTNGDVLTDIRYAELLDFHNRQQADATMAVRLHEWQHPFGVVEISGVEIVGFEEKPIARTHVNAGVYALNPSALDHLAEGQRCDMPNLFNALKEKGLRTVAYPMHEPWLDVGRPDDLEKAHSEQNGKKGRNTP